MLRFAVTYSDSDISILVPGPKGLKRARVKLPPGTIQAGRIVDSQAFGTTLKQIIASRLRKPRPRLAAVVGLPEEYALIKVIAVPKSLMTSELEGVFRYHWQTILPVAVEEVYYDYLDLTRKKEPGREKHFLIVAYPKLIIDSILSTLGAAGIVPRKLVPLSFGLAELFASSPPGKASLVIHSEDGKSLAVAVVEGGHTRFSTTIHAAIGAPTCLRQLENVQKFYEANRERNEDKIAKIIIIRNQYAEALAKQVDCFTLPVEIAQGEALLGAKGVGVGKRELDPGTVPIEMTKGADRLTIRGAAAYAYEFDHYLPLFGLLRSRSPMTILPPAVGQAILAEGQAQILRANTAIVGSLAIILALLSFAFLQQLGRLASEQVSVAPVLADRLKREEMTVSQEVTALNQRVAKLTDLVAKRSRAAALIQAVETAAQGGGGIKLTGITYAHEAKTLLVTGLRDDRSSLTKFLDGLKESKVFPTVSPSLASWQAEGSSNFEITLGVGEKR